MFWFGVSDAGCEAEETFVGYVHVVVVLSAKKEYISVGLDKEVGVGEKGLGVETNCGERGNSNECGARTDGRTGTEESSATDVPDAAGEDKDFERLLPPTASAHS